MARAPIFFSDSNVIQMLLPRIYEYRPKTKTICFHFIQLPFFESGDGGGGSGGKNRIFLGPTTRNSSSSSIDSISKLRYQNGSTNVQSIEVLKAWFFMFIWANKSAFFLFANDDDDDDAINNDDDNNQQNNDYK
ncbi:hypothetical protein DERF_008446 [Dermatophagoides farinae]|uniref:Uncharacterized protein n=1 Tax=Dermatophagoides farinae TaxID=6954 RepID=A0A922I387_DERFA|nr:hypothetical protein DERF_008446 [Dermatophagoides farinae]